MMENNPDISNTNDPLRLNIGGTTPREGWKILNIQPGPDVDFIGDCNDLSQFADDSCQEVYASHVLEHLSYVNELVNTLKDIRRILVPGGSCKISVPDFELLCRMFTHPTLNGEQRFFIMNMIFGGQQDPWDFHKAGLSWEFLSSYLQQAGFSNWKRVTEFGLLENDCSTIRYGGQLISLNVVATK